MKTLLIGLLFALPVLATEPEVVKPTYENRIITIKNGQPVVVLVQTTPLKQNEAPPACERDIVVRIEHGQKLTTPNPFYDSCVESRSQFEQTKVKAQERGGEEL